MRCRKHWWMVWSLGMGEVGGRGMGEGGSLYEWTVDVRGPPSSPAYYCPPYSVEHKIELDCFLHHSSQSSLSFQSSRFLVLPTGGLQNSSLSFSHCIPIFESRASHFGRLRWCPPCSCGLCSLFSSFASTTSPRRTMPLSHYLTWGIQKNRHWISFVTFLFFTIWWKWGPTNVVQIVVRHIWISQTALDLTSGETELRQQAWNLKSVAQLNHFCYLPIVEKISSLTSFRLSIVDSRAGMELCMSCETQPSL